MLWVSCYRYVHRITGVHLLPDMNTVKIIKLLIISVLLLSLNGCSLHLRGYGNGDAGRIHYKSAQIIGSVGSPLYQILYTKINAIGIKIVDKPDDDTLILILGATKFSQKTVSVDSRSQDVEYSLSSKTVYYFKTKNSKPQKKFSGFTRSLLNKTDEIVASSHEGVMLQEEMIQQTADDIYIQFLRQK